jgi:NAD(P)-dependent dehydrogenase (short-subunit alcohol dehydrogenase family)
VIVFVHYKATGLPTAPSSAAAAAVVEFAAPVVAEVAAPVAVAGDVVEDAVVSIVEEMTGYGRDLLDLDLDLEADLGVDTVKQAEVFAAVRARFDIPRQEDLKLRDFPTLRHVIGFVHDKATDLPTPPTPPATAAPRPAEADTVPAASGPRLQLQPAFAGDIAATDRLPRRIPAPVLRPDLDRCVETGVTLGSGSHVLVVPDEGGVGTALAKRLRKLGVTVHVLDAASVPEAIEARLTEWLADDGIDGVYWLPALDEEPAIEALDLPQWREALRRRVKSLYAVVRHLDRHARLGTQGTFLVSATRLGGFHGYDPAGATAPLGGAVSGFTKAYKRERPDALVKVVDFPSGRKTAPLAAALIEETLRDPGAVEIGRAEERRWTVGLAEIPFGDGDGGLTLTPESVFVVTGAAGSIVSAIVADLATAAGGGTFHLLDLTPEPDPTDEELRLFVEDRDALKPRIAERIKARGDRPTPVLVERELSGFERKQAALTAIQAVQDAGGTVRYHATDLRDEAAVTAAIDVVRTESGRIDVLLHAAGLEISRAIADKEPGEFDLVFDVKSDGWFNLLHAIGDLPLAATVGFSSVAGRFGNAGQTDYSAANDLLCKTSSSFRRTRPDTRAIALDWSAWGGIGMATRGSIPKVMEMAGIDMLPPEAGIAWIRHELTAAAFRGEVVVGGALGILGAELHPTGGLDVTTPTVPYAGSVVHEVTSYGLGGLVVTVTLDPTTQPFLDHHRIDGTAVLPGVMGVETFAEVAQIAVPELRLGDVENVRFLAPVKFYRDEPRTLVVRALPRRDGADVVVDCVLEGTRELKTGPETTVHFTGQVRLTSVAPKGEHDDTPTKEADRFVGRDDVYKVYFHGPAYQVLDEAWRYNGGAVGRLTEDLPTDHEPADVPFATEPRLLELCFQTAGVMQIGLSGVMALPRAVDRIGLLRTVDGASPLYAVVHPVDDESFDCRVVDADGEVLLRLDGYRTVPLPGLVPDELGEPLRTAMRT